MRSALSGMYWFFCIAIAVFSFVVVGMATTVGFDEAAPHLAHYVANHSLVLYAHIVFGPLALLLAPFQFWSGLRNRHRLVHRAIGYSYATAIIIAGLSALLLLPRFTGSPWAAIGFGLLALAWMGSTLRAVILARARRNDEHRAWMMRSAALTFAAVVLRLMTLPLTSAGLSLTEAYDITAWASWLIPLAVIEWALRRPLVRAARA